ncbi:MAG: hypothetical protein JWM43_4071 [Acidobacteriaceae bacterium]|nr:hypothetical protein [Acidobacteriaceae bacterium]
MAKPIEHLSDEEILLFLDEEMSSHQVNAASRHLASCPDCALRREKMQSLTAELVKLHNSLDHPPLPSGTGPTALLKLRLQNEIGAREQQAARFKAAFTLSPRVYAVAALILAAVATGIVLQQTSLPGPVAQIIFERSGGIPNRTLTPGATRPVELADICPLTDDDADPALPAETQQVVFREYGIKSQASASEYQVDYLINPQLGGTNDIRNLWPEPYHSTVWNARVKDALETRLHQMVCDRQIDLVEAQRDIATDWISAYKKYFHSPKPV